MRGFFLLLLLSNLALLAYQLWTGSAVPEPSEAPELNAEKILLLDPARLPAPQGQSMAEASQAEAGKTAAAGEQTDPPPEAQAEQGPSSGQEAQANAAAPSGAAEACLAWGEFDTRALARAEELLKQRLPEIEYEREAPNGTLRYWVIIPPAPNDAETQARVERLKRKGAGDVVIVREEGPLRNAVSLGIYSTAATAQRRMAELERLSIRGARVRERRSGEAGQLVLLNVDPALRPNLDALTLELADSKLRAIACPERDAQARRPGTRG